MIERLTIENLILVQRADIEFQKGLNILTGETGAGKSAVLAAIRLLAGERADAQLIRAGAEMAVVEALLSPPPPAIEGVETPLSGQVSIRRELSRSGKSRCFIEDQLVSLQQLRQFVGKSIEIVDQSAAARLGEAEEQRSLLDSYGAALDDAKLVERLFGEHSRAKEHLEKLVQSKQAAHLEQAKLQEDLSFLKEANWAEGEEQKLEAEHTLLIHSQELLQKIGFATDFLTEGSQPAAAALKRIAHLIEQLTRLDPKLEEPAQLLKSSAVEIEEAARQLVRYCSQLEADPNRLQAIEGRIGEIEQVKRRFGKTWEEVNVARKFLEEKLERIDHLDEEIEVAKTREAELMASLLVESNRLSQKRERASIALSLSVQSEFKSLNLPDARFAISLQPKPLSPTGANEIAFLFAANQGQPLSSLSHSASGGELSRLLFALKSSTAEKSDSETLIFDEIDSNIGGQTAALLGAKLQRLAARRQLICVTHFVQVARCADHHLLVTKADSRTTIAPLPPHLRPPEYARMTGQDQK